MIKRVSPTIWVMLLAAPSALSQTDDEIIETVRTSVTKAFQEQASSVVPDSFHTSGLAPSDKERLLLQLANETATCFVDALLVYANSSGNPLSDLVSDDGRITFEGDSGYEFEQLLNPCIQSAWAGAGISGE